MDSDNVPRGKEAYRSGEAVACATVVAWQWAIVDEHRRRSFVRWERRRTRRSTCVSAQIVHMRTYAQAYDKRCHVYITGQSSPLRISSRTLRPRLRVGTERQQWYAADGEIVTEDRTNRRRTGFYWRTLRLCKLLEIIRNRRSFLLGASGFAPEAASVEHERSAPWSSIKNEAIASGGIHLMAVGRGESKLFREG